MPVIRDFQIQHPGVQIEVTAGNGALNLARGECDVALRATCNPPENLVGRKIAIIEWAPFACTGIDLTGTIYDREWVSYAGSLTNLKAALFLAQRVALQRIIYKSDTVLGVASAVREGIGIGYLPCRGDYTKVTYLHALMTAICVTRRVYAFAGLWASGEFGMAGVPRAPDRRRLITLSSAD
ncbi:LysR substrate-binding domain-containing protein [Sphingobium yanoikuyae]|nr:LysR substrate-binding domain-containing protein [Sphingobium yanoikuyae]